MASIASSWGAAPPALPGFMVRLSRLLPDGKKAKAKTFVIVFSICLTQWQKRKDTLPSYLYLFIPLYMYLFLFIYFSFWHSCDSVRSQFQQPVRGQFVTGGNIASIQRAQNHKIYLQKCVKTISQAHKVRQLLRPTGGAKNAKFVTRATFFFFTTVNKDIK